MRIFLSLLLAALAASASAAGPAATEPLEVFPDGTRIIFVARLEESSLSEWAKGASGIQVRQVSLRVRVLRVLEDRTGKLPAPGVFRVQIQQTRPDSRIPWGPTDRWADFDWKTGETFVVFGDGDVTTPSGIFERPLDIVSLKDDPHAADDIAFVLEGERLGNRDREAARLAAAARIGNANRGLFFARYLAGLTLASKGAARADLIGLMARAPALGFTPAVTAELFRSFHFGLALREQRPADGLHALAAACAHAVAASGDSSGELLDDVVQVYLPWLSRTTADWKTLFSQALDGNERQQAARALARLAGLDRFPPKARDLLRQLAQSLS